MDAHDLRKVLRLVLRELLRFLETTQSEFDFLQQTHLPLQYANCHMPQNRECSYLLQHTVNQKIFVLQLFFHFKKIS